MVANKEGMSHFQHFKKRKELIKHTECSDVLLQCEQLAGGSVNVCGAAEAPKEQAGK